MRGEEIGRAEGGETGGMQIGVPEDEKGPQVIACRPSISWISSLYCALRSAQTTLQISNRVARRGPAIRDFTLANRLEPILPRAGQSTLKAASGQSCTRQPRNIAVPPSKTLGS